ncbi:Outer membrane protein OmpV [Photobacterium marinum]|uniref:Outer membrane protein OmpV n=1 Tax=Photobacterium marinum TaxID=1056511 RepID=L8J6M9_9GAMM|nr:MipA/OmpV family protein [Photobacterium marinum]ELR63838.1 Outer membrane protein OmpV [Photobacterium marinum]
MKKLALIITASLLSTHALAGETYIRNGNIYTHEGAGFVEAGVVTGSELYKGQDKTTGALLNGGYHGEDFNADLSGINYRFFGDNNDQVNISAYFTAGGTGYEADDATSLKGMDKRKMSGDLGLNADIHLGSGTISTYLQHDVTGAYKGFIGGAKYFHVMDLGYGDFVPFAGVSFLSKDFVNYYYGVKASEATKTRKAYSGKNDFAFNVGYKFVMPVTKNIDITQTTAYTRLGSKVSDSPIVDSANQWMVGATVAYHF